MFRLSNWSWGSHFVSRMLDHKAAPQIWMSPVAGHGSEQVHLRSTPSTLYLSYGVCRIFHSSQNQLMSTIVLEYWVRMLLLCNSTSTPVLSLFRTVQRCSTVSCSSHAVSQSWFADICQAFTVLYCTAVAITLMITKVEWELRSHFEGFWKCLLIGSRCGDSFKLLYR